MAETKATNNETYPLLLGNKVGRQGASQKKPLSLGIKNGLVIIEEVKLWVRLWYELSDDSSQRLKFRKKVFGSWKSFCEGNGH